MIFGVLQAQVDAFEPQVRWDSPDFSTEWLQANHIQSVHIASFEVGPKQRGEAYQSGVAYHYNRDASLIRQIETGKSWTDTVKVHRYKYSNRGVLCWETTEDRRWKRTYRAGYRFNGSGDPYQVKSYEVLRNDERLLLESRQYIYADNGALATIRLMENRHMVRAHHFYYVEGEPDLVHREVIENGKGELIKQVTYAYDEQDRVAHVVMTEATGKRSEYRYSYNPQNQPLRIEWLEGEKTIGLVLYEYNERGWVTHMSQNLYPGTPQQRSRYKVFEYDLFPPQTNFQATALKR